MCVCVFLCHDWHKQAVIRDSNVTKMSAKYFIMQVILGNAVSYEYFSETSRRQWKCWVCMFQQPLLHNSLRQCPLTAQCGVTYPTLSIRVRSSPLSVRASKFRTKMPKALDGSISIFSFSSSPKPTTEASWPLLVTIRIRTLGVGAVFVTMLVPDGRNGTLWIWQPCYSSTANRVFT